MDLLIIGNMKASEKIIQEIDSLPPKLQGEILDFIGYLKLKEDWEFKTNQEWSHFSIKSALTGLEDDEFPDYTSDDLKEVSE